MNEQFLLGLVVGGVIGAILARVTPPARQTSARSWREAKLDALLKQHGIAFDPFADVPHSVMDALRRGKKIEAIKEFRAATGADLKDAKDAVDEFARRMPR